MCRLCGSLARLFQPPGNSRQFTGHPLTHHRTVRPMTFSLPLKNAQHLVWAGVQNLWRWLPLEGTANSSWGSLFVGLKKTWLLIWPVWGQGLWRATVALAFTTRCQLQPWRWFYGLSSCHWKLKSFLGRTSEGHLAALPLNQPLWRSSTREMPLILLGTFLPLDKKFIFKSPEAKRACREHTGLFSPLWVSPLWKAPAQCAPKALK